jgi:hypothetical protein
MQVDLNPPLELGRLVVDAMVLEEARVRIQWRLPNGTDDLPETVRVGRELFSNIQLHDETGLRFRYRGTYGGSQRGETVFEPGVGSAVGALALSADGRTAVVQLG